MPMMMAYNNESYTGAANYQVTTTNVNSFPSPSLKVKVLEVPFDVIEVGKYSVFEIANWFLSKEPMSHLKLQKLCYYAQAWNYALKNNRLIDSDFQAWIHGPVSPALYEKFRSFGFDSIKITGKYKCSIDDEDLEILESVWMTYGSYAANALEALTHRELPWIEARTGYKSEERCQVVILPSTMKKYYLSIYNGDMS
jgi:uncharacterized phage-associated protein